MDLSQTLATTVGDVYSFTFYLEQDSGAQGGIYARVHCDVGWNDGSESDADGSAPGDGRVVCRILFFGNGDRGEHNRRVRL